MAKNIVVLSDGTGQEGGKAAARNTNVYRLFNMLENWSPRQVVFYDAGIGTGWRKVTGTVGGAGMSNNIKEGYQFILDHYEAGDRIFLVGFSRGAATVRSLTGFINLFGMLPKGRPELLELAYSIYKTSAPLWKGAVRSAIRSRQLDKSKELGEYIYPGDLGKDSEAYGGGIGRMTSLILDREPGDEAAKRLGESQTNVTEFYKNLGKSLQIDAEEILDAHSEDLEGDPRRFFRAIQLKKRALAFLAANHSSRPIPIEFVGCFDTVAALGVPFPAVNAVINRLPGCGHKFHDFEIGTCVRHAYHALALDDRRKPFEPVPWTLPKKRVKEQTLRQVWFTGMHADVGGGYPHRGLSDITLAWMIRKAHDHGLLLDKNQDELIAEDFTDVMHDSRESRVARVLYRPATKRNLNRFSHEDGEKPLVHETVLLRATAPAIREWKTGDKDKAGDDEELNKSGSSYEPWILDGDLDKENKSYEVEKWVPYDRETLLKQQEVKWEDWLRRQRAPEEGQEVDEAIV